jgi:CubicO group peptidase (beta-lactamase class C family)
MRVPLTADARFAIGSVSKSFTAIAMLQLAAEGRIDLSAPVARYLPAFSVRSTFEPITVQHLMVHSSGLPGYLVHASSSRFVLAALRDFEPSYAPGKHWSYSNTGYQLLGYILEGLDSQPYAAVIRRRILGPLGMDSSSAVIDDEQRAGMAVSYARWPYDGTYQEAPWFEYAAGDGSIVSTAFDMCTFARFLLNRGAGPRGRLLSEADFITLTTPVMGGYGCGLFVKQEEGRTTVGHEGGIAGYHAVLSLHLDEGFGLVLLSSSRIDDGLKRWVEECVVSAFNGSPVPRPPAQKSVLMGDARNYSGLYRAADHQGRESNDALEFIEENGHLALKEGDKITLLRQYGPDCFRLLGDSPGLPFFFARSSNESDARPTEVSRGAHWYVTQEFADRLNTYPPSDFSGYVGHFANNGPEGPVARLFVRNGQLWVMTSFSEHATPSCLRPVGQNLFLVDSSAPSSETTLDQTVSYSPERVSFHTFIDGRALRMIWSGVPLFRKDTP